MKPVEELYGVTIHPPGDGAAPAPSQTIRPAFDCLEVVQSQPRSLGDRAAQGVGDLARRAVTRIVGIPFRARAHGLSTRETAAWASQVSAVLSPSEQAELLAYVHACRSWESVLRSTICAGKADPDWDMTSARNVAPSAPEAYLAETLGKAGIPVQAQVGVAKARGGRRQGGWYGSFWLDCAHRDPAYLLRINIELDGRHHYHRERRSKDEDRNRILADRGWYVARLSARILGKEQHHRAVERLVALVERHRRAIILARSDLTIMTRQLSVAAGSAVAASETKP